MNPMVSVILPTRNRASMLREAIESVRSQTFADWELIVVDDGSTDETDSVVREAARTDRRIRCHRQAQGGVARARNAGIRLARGSFIAFLDDDDLFFPETTALQVRFLQRHPAAGFIYGQAEWMDPRGSWSGLRPAQPVRDLRGLLGACAITLPTVLCRKTLLVRTGGFDERLSIGEDYDLWLRLARLAPFEFLERPLVRCRVHGANTCNDGIRLYRQRALVLRKVPLDRSQGITFWEKRRRLAVNEYRLARLYRNASRPLQAARRIARAILYDPLVGLAISEARPSRISRFWLALKPYAALPWCLLRSIGLGSGLRWERSRRRDVEVAADLPRQQIDDFGMAGDG